MLGRLSELLLSLYRGSREVPMPAFQHWAFDRLQTAIDFDSALWMTGVLHADRDAATFHTHHLYRQPFQLLIDWGLCKDAAIFSRKVFAFPGRAFTCTPSMEMGPELAAHARRYQIEQILATTQVEPVAGIHELVSLYRSDTERPFSEEERLFQQCLVPHLSETWRLCRMRHLAHLSQPDSVCDAHAADADMQGVLQLIDPGFTCLLREEWPDWMGPRLPAELFESRKRGESRYIGQRAAFRLFDFEDHTLLHGRRKLPVDDLTRREREVAAHYAIGRSHKEIAQSLGLSPATVRNHLSAAYLKLGVDNKAALTAVMREPE